MALSNDLNLLHQIIDEMPSGVSREQFASILHLSNSQEIRDYILQYVASNLKKNLDSLWSNFEIPNKLKELRKLQKKFPKEEVWQPITGTVNLNPTIGHGLMKRKEELEKEINTVKNQTKQVQADINNLFVKIDEEIKEFVKI